MVKDITIGQYFPGNSFLHKLDARAKIVSCFLLIIFIFICKNFASMGIMLLTVAVTYAFSKLSPRLMVKSLKPLLPIILLTSVLQLYYNNTGDVLWSYKKIAITDGGI